MAKPQGEPGTRSYLKDVKSFYEILAYLAQDDRLARDFWRDLLTDSEIRMILRRWHIACLLAEGKGVRETASIAKVGTDTVNRVAKAFRSGRGALKRAVEMAKSPRPSGMAAANTFVSGDLKD